MKAKIVVSFIVGLIVMPQAVRADDIVRLARFALDRNEVPLLDLKHSCGQTVRRLRQNERAAAMNGARIGSAGRAGRTLLHLVRRPETTLYLRFISVKERRANFAYGQEDGFRHGKNGVMPLTKNNARTRRRRW